MFVQYIDINLLPIYRNWGKRTIVTLIYRDIEWPAKVQRYGRACKIGLGWDEFRHANTFVARDKLRFKYMGHQQFEVTKAA